MEGAHEDYICPVCREIIKEGVQIIPCNHEACVDCSKHLSNKCPVCRESFRNEDLKIINKTQDLKIKQTRCECGQTMSIIEYKDHVENCKTAKEISESSKSNLLDKSKMKYKFKKMTPHNIRQTVNRSTFTCPICKETNLERAALVNHVIEEHPHKNAVCPICVAQPWGDPNYVTKLSSHLKMRHQFDYDTYTDYDHEDDVILRQVLEQSKQEDLMLKQALELSKNQY